MSLIGYFLPIIIILVLIGLIVFSINRAVSGRNKYVNSKRIHWMLGGYVVVLLIAVAVFFTIPIEQDISAGQDSNQETRQSIISLHLRDEASDFIVSKEELSYVEDELNIHLITDDQYQSAQVLVERKGEADERLEVVVYQTPTFIDEMNITKYIDPIQIELAHNDLRIDGIRQEFSYASFRTAFPFSQFEADRQPMFEENVVHGEQLLFLRIPKDLEIIEKENVEVIYLSK